MENGSGSVSDKIVRLKAKQKTLEESWSKIGNRSLLQFFIDITPSLVNAERCSIFIFNPESDTIWLYCGTDLQEMEIQVPREGSAAGQALSSGHYEIVIDMDEKAGSHEYVDISTGFTTYNTLSLPIFNKANSRAIGVLQILNKRGGSSFSNEDITLMQRLSGEISRHVESCFKHQKLVEILTKIRKRIKKLESSQTKKGIQQRMDEEVITSILTTKTMDNQPGHSH